MNGVYGGETALVSKKKDQEIAKLRSELELLHQRLKGFQKHFERALPFSDGGPKVVKIVRRNNMMSGKLGELQGISPADNTYTILFQDGRSMSGWRQEDFVPAVDEDYTNYTYHKTGSKVFAIESNEAWTTKQQSIQTSRRMEALVKDWTPEMVASHLREVDLGKYANTITTQGIDGALLLDMDPADWQFIGLSEEDYTKMHNSIEAKANTSLLAGKALLGKN